ncbi:amidase [Burkholderia pseudomallei]|uniref:Amidase family protein n=1 Tax=Burkholderia pseudomallei TaxID=28450 RepID=A0AA40MFG0_BURPE|nr:amidase [Burkholderia pseudomallei]KGS72890.1 amidase family protein [Burkholderia pseudomallei MSHR5596]KGW74847.1 amidase family protein [Burkholderia pseudomallei MSHR2990]KGX17188.1 amidase family protein [Burkholderia pseudomallei]
MTSNPFYRPVSGLDLIRQISSTPEARGRIISDALARIDDIESQIRAMTAVLRRDTAMASAAAARGPLAGMPVAVKDIFDTDDLVTSYGSPIYDGHKPSSDAAIVTALRRNGAVVVGKTVTSEFAYMAPTVTRNPCDTGRTAGGSSSGSAAAVAAGMVPFAIGSQTGGSTIRPASFCGIAGYKPTFGMLPTVGMKCFSWSFDTVGLFASGVRDVAYLGQVLSGRRLAVDSPTGTPVFGAPDSYPWTEPSANAGAVLEAAIRAIERCGGRVKRIRFDPWMAELISAHDTIQSYEAWQALGYEYDHYRNSLSSKLAGFLNRAGTVYPAAYEEARALKSEAKDALPKLFDGITALLTPSAPDEALDGLASTGDPAFNRNWTLLGAPCVNVPGLRGARGGPVGVQVIGRPWDDAQCLDAAAFVEQAIATYCQAMQA